MAYSAVPTVVTGDIWSAANHNTYLRDNLAALWPFTTAGDIAIASSAAELSKLSIGTAYQRARVKSDASGLEYVNDGLTLIEEHLCAVDTAYIEFVTIPQIYRHLKLLGQARSTKSPDGAVDLKLQFNGDTGANYNSQQLSASGTYSTASESIGAASAIAGSICAAGAPSGEAGIFELSVPNYRGGFKKQLRSISGYRYSTGSEKTVQVDNFASWSGSNAITSIKLFPTSGNFLTGTVISLYGFM